MRKIILAQLTEAESDAVQEKERNCSTYRTLLQNQFISEQEKENISIDLKEMVDEAIKLYSAIAKKYNIPFLYDMQYKISPEKKELFIEVFD